MKNFTELASAASHHPVPFTDQLRLAVAAYLARTRAPPVITPNRTCGASSPGGPSAGSTHWPRGARTWSCTSAGCRRSAGSSRPRSRGASRSRQAFTGPASSTACWSTHPPVVRERQRDMQAQAQRQRQARQVMVQARESRRAERAQRRMRHARRRMRHALRQALRLSSVLER
jgi:hypothetical protein